MAVIGLSLILASLVYLIIRPPPWFTGYISSWNQPRIEGRPTPQRSKDSNKPEKPRPLPGSNNDRPDIKVVTPSLAVTDAPNPSSEAARMATVSSKKEEQDTKAMPPPPPMIVAPSIQTPEKKEGDKISMPPPPPPPKTNSSKLSTPPTPVFNLTNPSTSNLMPPPSRPRPPTLLSPSSSSLVPPPSRAQGPGTSTLAPPPSLSASASLSLSLPTTTTTTSSRRAVVKLKPGRSPLDWARLSSSPTSDLRNLPPCTPYLKVTRSQLCAMNGRKGADAWTALDGRVYNMEAYREYHPGGVGELLRAAGKDGTRLFGEVHPWVNYESMLQACLVGVLVDDHEVGAKGKEEDDGGGGVGVGVGDGMEEMD